MYRGFFHSPSFGIQTQRSSAQLILKAENFSGLEKDILNLLVHDLSYATICNRNVIKGHSVSSGFHFLMDIMYVSGTFLYFNLCLAESTTSLVTQKNKIMHSCYLLV